jgi:hypothetical protein
MTQLQTNDRWTTYTNFNQTHCVNLPATKQQIMIQIKMTAQTN